MAWGDSQYVHFWWEGELTPAGLKLFTDPLASG